MPRLSVVMPVFNGEAYLAEAIESILGQTASDYEFLILDDGSTDRTPDIARAYAARDSRIRYLRDDANVGVARRLNQGVRLAKAPLIARMDADDVSLPGRFAAQLARLDADPELVLVGSRVVIIDPDGDELVEMGDAFTHEDIDGGLMASAGQLIYHPSVIYRKAAVLAVGGYDPAFRCVEDLDLFLKLAEYGRVANIQTPLLKYREHFRKIGFTRVLEQEREIDRAVADAHRRRGDTRKPCERVAREAESKAATHRKWGWWALSGRRLAAARKHAGRALVGDPFNVESARLLMCALRGR
ncbi:MAG: glycosyltransferase family 2 protein [Amphiplicatus sp.]